MRVYSLSITVVLGLADKIEAGVYVEGDLPPRDRAAKAKRPNLRSGGGGARQLPPSMRCAHLQTSGVEVAQIVNLRPQYSLVAMIMSMKASPTKVPIAEHEWISGSRTPVCSCIQ